MKKKGTRKIRKNKRTTQRRKNRSYKRMRGGLPWWMTPLKTSIDSNATTIISESLPILGISTNPLVMPTQDKINEFSNKCDDFIRMMENSDEFTAFYESNKKRINNYFELLMITEFTHISDYNENIRELFRIGKIPNTTNDIIRGLKKYISESRTQHKDYKKFNLLAFALSIMAMHKLNIFTFPLLAVSSDEIKSIKSSPILQGWAKIHDVKVSGLTIHLRKRLESILSTFKTDMSTLIPIIEKSKNDILKICGIHNVTDIPTITLLEALFYHNMLPETGYEFQELYSKDEAKLTPEETIKLALFLTILINNASSPHA